MDEQCETFISEKDFLSKYDPTEFGLPIATVDTVIFTVLEGALHVLIMKRNNYPYQCGWSLVGGFIDVHKDEDLEATARRKLLEKTGVETPYLEQFGTIGNKDRDPRGWSVTTVYFALIPGEGIVLRPGEGARDIAWARIEGGGIERALSFDHTKILTMCLERLRSKVLYTSLPVHLMPGDFTLGELQRVYEIIIESKIDHKSFRRRILNAGILEETGEFSREARRPAQLYRLKEGEKTHFFIRNLEGAAV